MIRSGYEEEAMSEPGQNLAQIASVAIMSGKQDALQTELRKKLAELGRKQMAGSPPPKADTGSRPDTPPPPPPPEHMKYKKEKGLKIFSSYFASYLENIQKTDVDELMKDQLMEEVQEYGAADADSFRVLLDFHKFSFFFCRPKVFPTFLDWCDAEIRFNECSERFVMKFKEKKVEWILEFRFRKNRDVCASQHVPKCKCMMNSNSPEPESLHHMAEKDIDILYPAGSQVYKSIEKKMTKTPSLLKQKKKQKKPHWFPVEVLSVTQGEEGFPNLEVYGNIVVLTDRTIPEKIDKQHDIAKQMGVRCYSPRRIAKNYLEKKVKNYIGKPDQSIRLWEPEWDAWTNQLLADEKVLRAFTFQLQGNGMLI